MSRCLGFDACRYNGQLIPNRFLAALAEHVDFETVCPEVEIGLGIPRDPIRLVRIDGSERLVQPSTERDLTDDMVRYNRTKLGALQDVDGFVLKSRSPSCAVTDAKLHATVGKGPTLSRRPGLFAEAVLERFPHLPVEDEGRLTNFRIREHFLARIFALASFRRVRKTRRMGELVRYHAEHKLFLMASNQTEMRALGRIVANPDRRPISAVLSDYETHLGKALFRIPRYTSHVNVVMHALGYFKKGLTAREKAHFLDTLEIYRDGQVPLSALLSILRSWIARFDEDYLADQTYFQPFPLPLVEITDSGKGRGK